LTHDTRTRIQCCFTRRASRAAISAAVSDIEDDDDDDEDDDEDDDDDFVAFGATVTLVAAAFDTLSFRASDFSEIGLKPVSASVDAFLLNEDVPVNGSAIAIAAAAVAAADGDTNFSGVLVAGDGGGTERCGIGDVGRDEAGEPV
jgi:hypothetical protein